MKIEGNKMQDLRKVNPSSLRTDGWYLDCVITDLLEKHPEARPTLQRILRKYQKNYEMNFEDPLSEICDSDMDFGYRRAVYDIIVATGDHKLRAKLAEELGIWDTEIDGPIVV